LLTAKQSSPRYSTSATLKSTNSSNNNYNREKILDPTDSSLRNLAISLGPNFWCLCTSWNGQSHPLSRSRAMPSCRITKSTIGLLHFKFLRSKTSSNGSLPLLRRTMSQSPLIIKKLHSTFWTALKSRITSSFSFWKTKKTYRSSKSRMKVLFSSTRKPSSQSRRKSETENECCLDVCSLQKSQRIGGMRTTRCNATFTRLMR
jgi:hypothetical protein